MKLIKPNASKCKIMKLSSISNNLYMLSFGIMCVAPSTGLTSQDQAYYYFLGVSLFFLLIGSVLSRYSAKKILMIVFLLALLAIINVLTGELTLILSFLFIAFFRGTTYNKTLMQAVALKAFATIVTIMLAANNIISNGVHTIPKFGENLVIYDYGFIHPNIFFGNVFCILITLFSIYYSRVKWYHLVGATLLMSYLYFLTMCRSGFLSWILFILILVADKVFTKYGKVLLYLIYTYTFPFMFLFSVTICILYNYGSSIVLLLDVLLTGRITFMLNAFNEVGFTLFGGAQIGSENIYIKLLCGYGIVISIMLMITYVRLIRRLLKMHLHNIAIGLTIFSVYGFVEQFVLNITYNPLLLYFSILFVSLKKIISSQNEEKYT